MQNASNFLQVSPEWDFRRALLFQGLHLGFINMSELKTELAKNNSVPSIICLLTKDSCWSLKHKDWFVDVEMICILSSILKRFKTKSEWPDSVHLCMLVQHRNISHYSFNFFFIFLFAFCLSSFKVKWEALVAVEAAVLWYMLSRVQGERKGGTSWSRAVVADGENIFYRGKITSFQWNTVCFYVSGFFFFWSGFNTVFSFSFLLIKPFLVFSLIKGIGWCFGSIRVYRSGVPVPSVKQILWYLPYGVTNR